MIVSEYDDHFKHLKNIKSLRKAIKPKKHGLHFFISVV